MQLLAKTEIAEVLHGRVVTSLNLFQRSVKIMCFHIIIQSVSSFAIIVGTKDRNIMKEPRNFSSTTKKFQFWTWPRKPSKSDIQNFTLIMRFIFAQIRNYHLLKYCNTVAGLFKYCFTVTLDILPKNSCLHISMKSRWWQFSYKIILRYLTHNGFWQHHSF